MENQWSRIVDPSLILLQVVFEFDSAAVDDVIEDDRCDLILPCDVDSDRVVELDDVDHGDLVDDSIDVDDVEEKEIEKM